MMTLPALFISHGAPTLAIVDSPAHRFLQELGAKLPRPMAILAASAHWETQNEPALSLATHPETMHDFGGFPDSLYEIQYPAPGAPEIAGAAAKLLEQAGINVKRIATRGLDHGAWVPLHLMYPQADIPVAQISLVRGASPEAHEKMGRALRDMRKEGVLIVGSGSLTHNLREFRGHSVDAEVPLWVSEFEVWMKSRLENNDCEALRDYRNRAPHALRNHPTEEHLLPLYVAMGAAQQEDGVAPKIEQLHASYEYGVLAMDVFAFS